jgi:hypothetical protein
MYIERVAREKSADEARTIWPFLVKAGIRFEHFVMLPLTDMNRVLEAVMNFFNIVKPED